MNNQTQNNTEITAIKAVAAVSATPFRTAFKLTMGVMVAQFVGLLIFLGAVGTAILVAALFIKG